MKGKLCGAKTRAGTPCKRLAQQSLVAGVAKHIAHQFGR